MTQTSSFIQPSTLCFLFTSLSALIFGACDDGGISFELDTAFDIPRTEAFSDVLSSYALYEGDMNNLAPAQGVYVYDIPSKLFTDYAYKQRLLKLPVAQRATISEDGSVTYPEGTIIAKTFLYFDDFRDTSQGHRVLETRLLVKRQGIWNAATYIWNDTQTDATLSLEGAITPVQWIDEDGQPRSTNYEIPGEVACVTCHQHSNVVSPIGATSRNLNMIVERQDESINQLTYLSSQGVFEETDPQDTQQIIDFNSTSSSLERRARAYLDANCSHCHQPNAWERAANQDLDFRFETPLANTGILEERNAIERLMSERQMPLVGTTVLDEEGIALVFSYLETL